MDKQSGNYMLSAHGDQWAMETSRMRAYLNTPIVSDMLAEECEALTGPGAMRLLDYAGGPVYDSDWVNVGHQAADGSDNYLGDSRLEAALSARRAKGAIAVLPLMGPITQRSGLFSAFFGGTSAEKFGRAFGDLIASPNVSAVVIEVDSPGGTVSGVPELADKIHKARDIKPVIAVANGWAASAAYWLASQASELVVTPSGEVGSIGVWSMHVDISEAMEKFGEKVTIISAGKYKVEANPYEPLSEEALAYEQSEVDRYYGMFVSAVARGRGKNVIEVRKGFGQGRMVGPAPSKVEGMVDRVATMEATIKRLGGRLAERDEARAEAEARELELKELGAWGRE